MATARRSPGPSNVIVERDRIVSVGRGSGEFDAVIEGDGGYLLPGLINLHAHLRSFPMAGTSTDISISSTSGWRVESRPFDRWVAERLDFG